MRTTVTLDEDVVVALQSVQREKGVGLSQAVNALIRSGLSAPTTRHPWEPLTADIGLLLEVSNIGEVLEQLDGYE